MVTCINEGCYQDATIAGSHDKLGQLLWGIQCGKSVTNFTGQLLGGNNGKQV